MPPRSPTATIGSASGPRAHPLRGQARRPRGWRDRTRTRDTRIFRESGTARSSCERPAKCRIPSRGNRPSCLWFGRVPRRFGTLRTPRSPNHRRSRRAFLRKGLAGDVPVRPSSSARPPSPEGGRWRQLFAGARFGEFRARRNVADEAPCAGPGALLGDVGHGEALSVRPGRGGEPERRPRGETALRTSRASPGRSP
jgi:hypothetical protein